MKMGLSKHAIFMILKPHSLRSEYILNTAYWGKDCWKWTRISASDSHSRMSSYQRVTNVAELRATGCSSERRSPWRWSTYLLVATPARLQHRHT